MTATYLPPLAVALAKAERRIERLEAALRYVTDVSADDSEGCPGSDKYGPHADVLHVAPVHCDRDSCVICEALAGSAQ
jgi:hypothetical protein